MKNSDAMLLIISAVLIISCLVIAGAVYAINLQSRQWAESEK